jgi:hypothetical protein
MDAAARERRRAWPVPEPERLLHQLVEHVLARSGTGLRGWLAVEVPPAFPGRLAGDAEPGGDLGDRPRANRTALSRVMGGLLAATGIGRVGENGTRFRTAA